MGGVCNSLIASCAYSCNCCICDCCLNQYGGNGVNDEMFNDQLGLVIYDKMSKDPILNPIYPNREDIFKELQLILNDYRIQRKDDEINKDLIIADIGCGTGGYIKIICDTFISSETDKLICIDTSPKALQFVRNKIVKKNKNLQNYDISYINNEVNSLCLAEECRENRIDLAFMAFVLYHIDNRNNSRESIFKEIYKSLKPNGMFVIFEFSPEHFDEVNDNLYDTRIRRNGLEYNQVSDHDDNDDDDDNNDMFQTVDDLKQYIIKFGFKFEKMIEHLYDNQQWLFIFRK